MPEPDSGRLARLVSIDDRDSERRLGTVQVLPRGYCQPASILLHKGGLLEIFMESRLQLKTAIRVELGSMMYLAEVVSWRMAPQGYYVSASVRHVLDLNRVDHL
jgi:hypothetical protein